jgi:hypothetical protein
MSFENHLQQFLQNRAQQNSDTPIKREQKDATQQSQARNAIAKEQTMASKRAEWETKLPHTCVNGRYHTDAECQIKPPAPQKSVESNEHGLQIIRQLRKDLKLKKSMPINTSDNKKNN